MITLGYTIPAFLTIIIITVGETAQNCKTYSPNFGNGRCWFEGNIESTLFEYTSVFSNMSCIYYLNNPDVFQFLIADIMALRIWLDIPLVLSLTINSICFCKFAKVIYDNYRRMKSIEIQSDKKSNEL